VKRLASIHVSEISEEEKTRFWQKVEKRSDSECWEWKAHRTPEGYGRFKFRGRLIGANRFTLWLSGIDTENLVACHHCDNPPCCNPAHLYAGTYADNSKDCFVRNRREKFYPRQYPSHVPKECLEAAIKAKRKLTPEQVLEIRKSNETDRVLGLRYGVAKGTIFNIKSHRTWKTLT